MTVHVTFPDDEANQQDQTNTDPEDVAAEFEAIVAEHARVNPGTVKMEVIAAGWA